jgi:probable phosphoglycerate mutase
MLGQYRVRHAGLQPLYQKARALTDALDRVAFEHVRREENTHADRLANMAMDEGAAQSTVDSQQSTVKSPSQ